ncbi:hypothetical protein [Rhodopirellula baltica]|uniref:Uncharacterized protein n=1 Tax=Rhodopirellula baltica WH47 TaxID=991778 RepID=F2APF2_RHOBT|nr:hypothetical protein [Rhodopirellula baltica]EGF28447.1 conserved hypothetical protein, membrane [Rhodopirellula baltica WH47]
MSNPYQTPSEEVRKEASDAPVWHWFAASLFFLSAAVISSPGVVFGVAGAFRPNSGGRQYATYDPEVFLFGIAIIPATAQWLAFAVAPALVVISIGLVWRGILVRRRYRATTSSDQ